MRLRLIAALTAALTAAACAVPPGGVGGSAPGSGIYRIGEAATGQVQLRMLDSVNALRRARALGPLALEPALIAAAATHARDMSIQNRPWHFGSDGSSPLSRAQRAGYAGMFLGELISETFETEIETLAAWMQQPDTRDVILAADATEMGFAFFQEPNGKFWWVLTTGTGLGGLPVS